MENLTNRYVCGILSIPNYFDGVKQLQNLYLEQILIFLKDKYELYWISLENAEHRLFEQFFQYVEVALPWTQIIKYHCVNENSFLQRQEKRFFIQNNAHFVKINDSFASQRDQYQSWPGIESALFQSVIGYQRFLHIDIRAVSLEHRLFPLNPPTLRLFFSDVEYCALLRCS